MVFKIFERLITKFLNLAAIQALYQSYITQYLSLVNLACCILCIMHFVDMLYDYRVAMAFTPTGMHFPFFDNPVSLHFCILDLHIAVECSSGVEMNMKMRKDVTPFNTFSRIMKLNRCPNVLL